MLISILISISINIFMLILTSIKLINKINGLISGLVSNKKTVSVKPKLNDINSIFTASNSLQWRTGIGHCKNCKHPFYFIKR